MNASSSTKGFAKEGSSLPASAYLLFASPCIITLYISFICTDVFFLLLVLILGTYY